jgi:two-component system LytT family response regulator
MAKLVLRAAGRVVALDETDVLWLEASHNYVVFHANGNRYVVRGTLENFIVGLDPRFFMRTHRGAVVNLARVIKAEHHSGSRVSLLLTTGERVPVSRSRAKTVLEALELGGTAMAS